MSGTGLTRLLTRPLNVELNTLLDVRPGFASSSAAQFLDDYSTDGQGFVMTFARQNGKGASCKIVDTGTPANDNDLTLFSNFEDFNSVLTLTAPSPKITRHSDGDWKYQAHNLATYSDDVSNAAWGKVAVSVPDSETITGDGTAAAHFVKPNSDASASPSGRTVKCKVKSDGHDYVQIYFDADAAPYANFDLALGAVGTTGSGTTSTISGPDGDGFYTISATTTSTTATRSVVQLGFGRRHRYQ